MGTSPSLAPSTMLHVSVRLITRHRHAHNPEGNPYKAMQRAETCTTIRGHNFHLTLSESQPKLRPSALTQDSHAEQSPVAAVAEDCISLSEQAAIEPEAALPPSFPIR